MTRTLADDLAQLARLDAIIERQADHVSDLQEFVQLPPYKKGKPVTDPEGRARWHSARRRLRWMMRKRKAFAAVVHQALRDTPSPYAPQEDSEGTELPLELSQTETLS